MSPHLVRVYLADDHPMFLEGVVQAIRERADLELVGSASDGHETLADLRQLRPDVAVLDVRMREMNGTDVLANARREGLPTRIVFLSAHVESGLAYAALAAGATGYLSKEIDREAIFDAVAAAARGEVVLSPCVQTGIADEIKRRETASRPRLTPREREVLALSAEGYSTRDIGKSLHLSPATVKTHLQSLYEKLGVSDRTAAVAVALRGGLLE